MKLVIGVVQDQDAPKVIEALNSAGFLVTKLASTGGFLRQGNTTLMTGVADDQVPRVKQVFREHCQARDLVLPPGLPSRENLESVLGYTPPTIEVHVGGAVLWVLDVAEHARV